MCTGDIPEKIEYEFAGELPGLLARHLDGGRWEMPLVADPLTGSEREASELHDACRERRIEVDWDLAACLTDLPVYRDGRLVVADASAARGVALFSLPALRTLRHGARGRLRLPSKAPQPHR